MCTKTGADLDAYVLKSGYLTHAIVTTRDVNMGYLDPPPVEILGRDRVSRL